MYFTSKKSAYLSIVASLLATSSLSIATPAHAGFEWTPPPQVVQDAVMNEQTQNAAPSGPLTPEIDSSLPVPVGNVEVVPVQDDSTPIVTPSAENVTMQQEPQPTPAIQTEESPSSPFKGFPITEGFGKDIPLAIAIRDIVPNSLAYSFSPKEIAGTKISWRGGKPWPEVLHQALAPHGLDASLNENTMLLFKVNNASNSLSQIESKAETPMVPDTIAEPVPLMPAITETPSQVSPVIPVMDVKITSKWEARPGVTLRQTLESWAKQSNVELNWSTPYDYPVNNAFYFSGSFSDAVQSLLSTYGGGKPSPKGRLYPNLPDGPSVLMIN